MITWLAFDPIYKTVLIKNVNMTSPHLVCCRPVSGGVLCAAGSHLSPGRVRADQAGSHLQEGRLPDLRHPRSHLERYTASTNSLVVCARVLSYE